MFYPLTIILYIIATSGGLFSKTNKIKDVELISKDVDDELFHPDSETLVSEDANAIFYYLSQMPGETIRDFQH